MAIFKNKYNSVEHFRLVTEESKLFVSIMAGTKMETLAGNLRTIVHSPRIIRVHPNTPAMVGQGCSVYSLGEGTTTLLILQNLKGYGNPMIF